jgi:hypothetical protein
VPADQLGHRLGETLQLQAGFGVQILEVDVGGKLRLPVAARLEGGCSPGLGWFVVCRGEAVVGGKLLLVLRFDVFSAPDAGRLDTGRFSTSRLGID